MEIVIVLVIIAAAVYWMRGGEKVEVVKVEAPVAPPAPKLDELTKAELIEFAEKSGVEVKKSWTKAKIVQVIEADFATRSGFER